MKKFSLVLCVIFTAVLSLTGLPVPGAEALTTIQSRIIHYHGNAIDIQGASNDCGARAILWRPHNRNNQQFRFEKFSDGYWRIIAVHSGKVLTPASGSHGAEVVQQEWAGTDLQKWDITSRGEGWYKVVNKQTGLYLDNQGGRGEVRDRIVQWEGNDSHAQWWRVESTIPESSGGGVSVPGGSAVSPASLGWSRMPFDWINEDRLRMSASPSQVIIDGTDRSIVYNYEWNADKTEFDLSRGEAAAVMRIIGGEKPVLRIEGFYLGDRGERIPISESFLRLKDAGVKIGLGIDGFDWHNPNNDKSEMAGRIIETWKKYGEQVDARFLNPRSLAEAIDAYSRNHQNSRIFEIALIVAGLDPDSYVYY